MQSLPDHFDAIIIGCGMSGLGAGIRLAMYGKKVLIVERHNAPGGLNSFYSIRGRKYDVGLHALTNYVPSHVKGTPLGRICRQLRIDREALGLCEQMGSRIAFPGYDLRFSNDFALLESEVAHAFPNAIDAFRKLVEYIKSFEYFDSRQSTVSARSILAEYLPQAPLLAEMLLCPLQYYGCAKEHDMDWDQFVILFKSIYLEGFARPLEGVRRIIRVLLDRYRESGGFRKMKCGVARIHLTGDRVTAVTLDDGSTYTADKVFSTVGRVETERLCDPNRPKESPLVGPLSFCETITVLDTPPAQLLGCEDTIVFFNHSHSFHYASPVDTLCDDQSGVICIPNNYRYQDGESLSEGILRLTALANYKLWTSLSEADYQAAKVEWFARLRKASLAFIPQARHSTLEAHTLATDMFTPRTIEKFTSHLGGAVYGSPEKVRDGRTHVQNLFLCGTDQGMLGIIGAIHSGISIANSYGLHS